jgi:phage-related protein
MAGPIKIAIVADAGNATKSVKEFADGVSASMGSVTTATSGAVVKTQESMREVGSSVDRASEGFDRADTGAMGFRDTVTGLQDATALAKGDFDNLGEALLLGGFALGDMASGMVNFLLPSLKGAVGWVRNLTVVQRIMNITMLSNPVFLVVAAIAALVAIVVIAYKRSETFRRVVDSVWATIRGAWGQIPGFVSGIIGKIAGFFSGIKSRIQGFFSGARGWLMGAARDIIGGFVDGLRSGFRRVEDTLNSLTGMLPDWKGPAARDRLLLEESGQLVIAGFRRGLEDEYGSVERSLARWSGGLGSSIDATAGGSPAGRAPAGRGETRIVLELARARTGDQLLDAIWEMLRHRVATRARGNVQLALGR